MPEKVVLLDGNSLLNRAFFAMPALTNSNGEFTNAAYGFLNIFFKLYDEEKPDYIGIAFDLPKPTFRHKMFEGYKSTRKPMAEELRSQFPMLKNLLRLMNLKIYELEGYEADDVLGTLSRQAAEAGMLVTIVSGDRDLLQCATGSVKIRMPKTKAGKTESEDYFESDIIEKMGIRPSEYIQAKALMGDMSDNIPGVPGIGEKTAFKIIQEYKTVENAIQNAGNIKPKKASENLIIYKEQAYLSLKLVSINTNAPIKFDAGESRVSCIYTVPAKNEIARLGFKSLLPRFENIAVKIENEQLSLFSETTEPYMYSPIEKIKNENVYFTHETVNEYIQYILTKNIVAYANIFDGKKFLGTAFYDGNKPAFIPVSEGLTELMVVELLSPFFESGIQKLTIDAKKDITFLNKYGVKLENLEFDIMIGAYILNSSKSKYEYDDIAFEFLNKNPVLYKKFAETFLGKQKNNLSINIYELTGFGLYQAETVWESYPIIKGQIEANNQSGLYYNIELPLIYVLAGMEAYGIKADKNALTEYGSMLDEKIESLRALIYEAAGGEFNINSPKQLGNVLFDKLKLKGGRKTKTGWSTAAEVLENIQGENPIINRILEYRTYTKLKSTYVDGLLSVMDKTTGKIHSTFNQTVTSTGRISSTEPNLQNIPVRTEVGRQLRKVFIPSEPDYVFLDADYSQIELRILAHLSEDETFISAFVGNQDIHRLTASQVLHIPFDDVTQSQRRSAKAVNFGIIYGIGAFSLSKDIGVTLKEAENYINAYFEKYPRVKLYMDEMVKSAKEKGYASTMFNRRRAIPEITAENFNTRSFGERAAMNMPVQGAAADIIKIAMIRVSNRLKKENLRSRLILQVHDELLLEAYKPELPLLMEIVKTEMENAGGALKAPLRVDMNTGENWLESK